MAKTQASKRASPEVTANPSADAEGQTARLGDDRPYMFWVCLGFLVIFVWSDVVVRLRSQAEVTGVKTSDVAVSSIPVVQGARIRDTVIPPTGMDTRWWVIHTEEFLSGGSWRVRHTNLDNAPDGREVHWSSSLIWLLTGAAHVISAFTGKPVLDCVSAAAFWAVPVSLVMCLTLLGRLAAPRFGLGLTGVFLLIFSTSTIVYQCFRAGDADHHGIVCTFAVASVLGLVAGGGGLVALGSRRKVATLHSLLMEPEARRWFQISGALGGAALWVSAASFIPILAGCAAGAVVAFLFRDRSASVAAPNLWRDWAGAGCISSLGFYALEYFPAHMGWRLEVNHPLYAFAWLGAGDLLARFIARLEGKPFVERKTLFPFILSLAAILVPAAMIVLNSKSYFWVSDRFLLLLHNRFIQEFQSFSTNVADRPLPAALVEVFAWPAFVCLGTAFLSLSGRLRPHWRPLLVISIVPALVMHALALAQIRWSILALGLWSLCVLVLLAAYLDRTGPRSVAFLGVFLATLLAASLTFPALVLISLANLDSLKAQLPKSVIPTLLLRDVAHRLVQSSPTQLPVVLAGPTSSTELNYYGGVRTLGTLYWENRDGLKRAAHLFASSSDEEAKTRLREAGVTHIVTATWDNFGQAYVELLRAAGESVAPDEKLLVTLLQPGRDAPDWLRPLYYPIPATFGIETEKLLIFQFVENQTHLEAIYHRGVFAFDGSDYPAAERLFAEALSLAPANALLRQSLEAARGRLKTAEPTKTKPDDNPQAK